jgi:hypothetical protein
MTKITKAHTMVLYTDRNVLVFDEAGNQILRYQRAMTCYRINKKLALQATQEARNFEISQWLGWSQKITRREMQYMLGLRMKEMDVKEINDEQKGQASPAD